MAAAITSRRVHDQDFAWYDHYDDLFERYIDSSPVGSSDNTADPSGSEEDGRFFDTSAAAHEFSLEARGVSSSFYHGSGIVLAGIGTVIDGRINRGNQS